MLRFIAVLSTIALTFLLNSCKKEEDTQDPIVTITEPTGSIQVNVFDTIIIAADISEEMKLKSVQVKIVDENLIPALPAISISVSGNIFSFIQPYPIDEIHLESGYYFIQVSASDETNTTNAYHKIYITASPKERKGFYLISAKPNSVNVSFADNNFVISPKLSLTGDYSGSAISSYFQQLYTLGKYKGAFNAIDVKTHSVKWSVPVIQGSSPYFTSLINYDKMSYVSFYEGRIQGYDHHQAIRFNATVAEGNFPLKSIKTANYLFSEQKEISSPKKKLVAYYNTGAGMQECLIYYDVVSFFEKDNNNIYVLGNDATKAFLEIYNITGNDTWPPYNITAGKILSAAQINSNVLLIGLDDNTVYKFQYNPIGLTPFITGINANNLVYDELNNEVIATSGNSLFKYSYATGILNLTAVHTDSIAAVHILYNK